MSDNRQQQNNDIRADANQLKRTPPGRPPIQWPERQSTPTDQQREKAAEIARQRVDRLYNQQNSTAHIRASAASNNEQSSQQTQGAAQQPYNWEQYHNAWQQYYQQYFYRYYAGWYAQQKQQLESQQVQLKNKNDDSSPEDDRAAVIKQFRAKIKSTIEEQSGRVKKSSHFKPIMAALTVGGSFLLISYNQVIVGAMKQYVTPGGVVTTPIIVEPNTATTVGKDPKIIIPKIGVEAPVIYDEPRVDEASYQAALDHGVVRLGTTANPGTKGNVVLGGHSSNNVFNSGGYKYVFVNLKRLEVGDIFYLNYEGIRYTYKITVANKIVPPTDVSVLAQTEKPTVTLFTCDPPGTNINRLIVQAEQIDPSPSEAPKNTNQETTVNEDNPLPSVAPSLWDRIFRRG